MVYLVFSKHFIYNDIKVGEQSLNQNNNYEKIDDSDIFDSILILWHSKFKIIFITTLFGIFGLTYIFLSPQKFTSSATLSPVDDSSFSAGAAKYAGLANIAGFNIGAPSSSKTDIAIEVLKSREFFVNFVQKRELEEILFAVKSWDESTNELVFNPNLYDVKKSEWVENKKPNIYEGHKIWTEEILGISKDVQTSFVSISIKHQSPSVSFDVLRWLLEDIDNNLRMRDIENSSKAIEYLEEEVQKNASDDLRKLFFSLIKEQTNKKMMAVTHPEYIFDVIDPPFVPEVKSEPKSLLILISFLTLGSISAILFVFVSNILKTKRRLNNL